MEGSKSRKEGLKTFGNWVSTYMYLHTLKYFFESISSLFSGTNVLTDVPMETEQFIKTTEATSYRENIVASCLARKWRMCLNLTPYQPSEDYRKSFDYVLFDPMGIKQSVKIEQQDSFKIFDADKDSFVIKVATYQSTGKKLGKLHYCDCDLFCFVCPGIETIYLFKFHHLKQYIISLNEFSALIDILLGV